MASLYQSIIAGQKQQAAEDIAKQQAKAMKGEEKRQKRSGFFGGILGTGLGIAGGAALTALSGGALNPATLALLKAGVSGAGKTLGQYFAEEASEGKYGKMLKTSGQVDAIKSKSAAGYGREEAKTLTDQLIGMRKSTDVGLEELGGNVAGSIAALGTDTLKDYGLEKLGEVTSSKLKDAPMIFGEEGARTLGIGGEDFARQVAKQANIDNLDLDESNFWDYVGSEIDTPSDSDLGVLESILTSSNSNNYLSPTNPTLESSMSGQINDPFAASPAMMDYKMGGQVPKYYGGGAVDNKAPSITEYFKMKGKTMGGSDTMSIAQKLGK
ncbi:MAG: hypothetical protein CBD97_01750 [Pelagibacteraceae bacterium TMED237]|nr:MAG: hypothetical protein CBD97_01750 [Pelagibacteraceae bacterium TMED237]|tara:strand:+ start:1573 stop:2550 length:978 start_codon:yes stop_codon:yes gene_type:complete